MQIKTITVPLKEDIQLKPGDFVEFTGTIYCGRDAVLPHIIDMAERGVTGEYGLDLQGAVIFHTAVSCAGIAPTTSNKREIEGSILPLTKAGVTFHLGKGLITQATIQGLKELGGYFLVTPPTAALLTDTMKSKKAVVHPEFGIEAFWELQVERMPAIVAVANGETIFPEEGAV